MFNPVSASSGAGLMMLLPRPSETQCAGQSAGQPVSSELGRLPGSLRRLREASFICSVALGAETLLDEEHQY